MWNIIHMRGKVVGRATALTSDLKSPAFVCACVVVEDRSQSVRITSQLGPSQHRGRRFRCCVRTCLWHLNYGDDKCLIFMILTFFYCGIEIFLFVWGKLYWIVLLEMDVCTKMIHETYLNFGDEICKFFIYWCSYKYI